MEKYSLFVLRKIFIDAVILGLTYGLVYMARSTQPFQRGFFCGDQSIMYPYRNDTVTSRLNHAVGVALPVIMVILVETLTLTRRREEPRRVFGAPLPGWARGCYSVLVAFALGALCTELTTELTKVTIGRLRPCFLDVCKPNIDCSLSENQNRYISAEEFECTAGSKDQMRDIRLSFMSGHSSWAAFTMVFLALYLHRRLCWRLTRVACYFLQFTVVMLSYFTALTRVSDNRHHWSDVLMGYSTGTLFAVIVVTWCIEWVERPQNKLIAQRETATSIDKVVVNNTNL